MDGATLEPASFAAVCQLLLRLPRRLLISESTCRMNSPLIFCCGTLDLFLIKLRVDISALNA